MFIMPGGESDACCSGTVYLYGVLAEKYNSHTRCGKNVSIYIRSLIAFLAKPLLHLHI